MPADDFPVQAAPSSETLSVTVRHPPRKTPGAPLARKAVVPFLGDGALHTCPLPPP